MIKKNVVAIFVCLLTIAMSYAQKVDLDREYVDVSYVRLPYDPIVDPELRTYSISATSNYDRIYDIPNNITIQGFEKINDNGTVIIAVRVDDIIIDKVDIKKREEVKKDKEGNVTERKYYYKPVVTYKTSGGYRISKAGQPAGRYIDVSKRDNSYSGNEYSTRKAAVDYFNNNKYVLRDKFAKDYIRGVVNTINGKVNSQFGYVIKKHNTEMWILDSKKNSDYEGHKKAYADMKAMFSKMKYNQSVEYMKEEMKPIIAYFESVIPNYPEIKKRKHRKMRYASYFNIAKMYYYAEMPDKAIEYAQKLIENDYDKRDGKNLITSCENLKKKFETNKVNTRHFEVETNDARSNSDLAKEDNGSSATETVKQDKYVDVVYDKGDGTLVEGKLKLNGDIDLNNLDLTKYHKNIIRIYYLDDQGEAKNKGYFARENASYKSNGVTYEAVKFSPAIDPQSNESVVNLEGARYLFSKVLYKGKKLSLYKYKSELIFKKSGYKKGQSTSSMAYAIGFKKKLSKLVADCPDLAALAKDGSFTNTEESLLAFITEYEESCK